MENDSTMANDSNGANDKSTTNGSNGHGSNGTTNGSNGTNGTTSSSNGENAVYKRKLKDIVDTANAVTDLTATLEYISVDHVKQYLASRVDELDKNGARAQYYLVSNINEIFSDEISQYILSFAGVHHIKAVNRQWLRWGIQNEQVHFRALYSRISLRSSKGTKYNKKINKTWIIHPHRTVLNNIEIELGLSGPVKSLFGAIRYTSDGDLLLVFKGTYLTQLSQAVIAKNLRIVGVEPGVCLKSIMINEYRFIGVQNGHNICLEIENFSMDFRNIHDGTSKHGVILVGTDSGLLMRNCKLNYEQTGIIVRDGARLEAVDCEFNGGCIGIEISPISENVEVTNCLFTNNGQIVGEEESVITPSVEYGCVQVFDNFLELPGSKRSIVHLKCIGNTFRDNLCYPIVERSNGLAKEYFIWGTDKYMAKHNQLDGYNGTYTIQSYDITNADTLYHSQYIYPVIPG